MQQDRNEHSRSLGLSGSSGLESKLGSYYNGPLDFESYVVKLC